jgi:hypothetical protein
MSLKNVIRNVCSVSGLRSYDLQRVSIDPYLGAFEAKVLYTNEHVGLLHSSCTAKHTDESHSFILNLDELAPD